MIKLNVLQAIFASVFLLLICLPCTVIAENSRHIKNSDIKNNYYDIEYFIKFVPKRRQALVQIKMTHEKQLRSIDFNLKNSQCSGFKSSQTIEKKGSRLVWLPDHNVSSLQFKCKINHKRKGRNSSGYDAFINKNWTIFRGDDLIPPAKVSTYGKAKSRATLHFELPPDWTSVNTGWPRRSSGTIAGSDHIFEIDNPQRSFDRPTGWMIAGQLGTRRSTLASAGSDTLVSVSAPKNSGFRRMDALSFIHILWPEFISAFDVDQRDLLILGAGDPMWRGGLSAGNSFYVHADRPIISENGTSTLAHELFHMLTGIRGEYGDDWIAEGLAEFYSIELIYRAGASDDARKQKTFNTLENWAKEVSTLKEAQSSGKTTAAAVTLLYKLNLEIAEKTNGRYNLDALTRKLITESKKNKRISLEFLRESYEKLTGYPSSTLDSPLLYENKL